jgi:hypothetical protein
MRMMKKGVATISLVLLSTAGAVWAADDAKKPAAPTLSDVLDSSGLTLTGYIDGTFSYAKISGVTPKVADTNTFALNQAAFTLAKQPTDGFGGLVNVVAGTEAPCLPGGTGTCAPNSFTGNSSSGFDLLQAYLQYAHGKLTIMGGKFTTLVGAEVVAPTGNTNVTRSLLFAFEPVTHTGLRLAYAASDKATLYFGLNNGWNSETTGESEKTVELGASLTPSKMFSLAAYGYYGKSDCEAKGVDTNCSLLDLVATWNATSKLTLIGSVDYGQQDKGRVLAKNVSWSGVALYLNYAINDAWRFSGRVEQFDDSDGYLTGAGPGVKPKLQEGTLTFGYMPAKNFELRMEGRYDKTDVSGTAKLSQAWLQALYKF